MVGLSRTASGDPVPTARRRGLGRIDLEDRFTGWIATLIVFGLALFLRLWHLSSPKKFLFDETYYAKDAWSLLHFGHEQDYLDGIDAKILDGQTTDLWKDTPSMTVHPDVGKWLIALGEKIFGLDPFGWRVASAVIGALMILVMVRFVRRLTGSTLYGVLAGLLLSLDGLQLVLSRLALLDIFVAFFILCSVHCVVADRDWYRRRMAERVRLGDDGRVSSGWGPVRGLLFRPWLLAAGVMFGLACGSKWTAVYPLAAFGLMVWLWSAGARRSYGVRWATVRSALVDGIPAFFHLVLVAFVVYVATWGGWLAHASTYEEKLSSTQYRTYGGEGHCAPDPNDSTKENFVVDKTDPDAKWPTATEPDASGLGEVVQSLRSLWYYHQDVYTFHTAFLNCASHPYESMPSGWLLMNRPVGVDANLNIQPGTQGCDAPAGETCQRIVTLLGNPAIWWMGCVALLYAVVMWVGRRDWRFGVAVVGVASTWLPWLLYDERPIFFFYAINCLPFLVLAITLMLADIVGRDRGPSRRRTAGVIVAGTYVVLVLLAFAWFWPIWTDVLTTRMEWVKRMWLEDWI